MDGLICGDFNIEKDFEIRVSEKGVAEFETSAPSWFSDDDKIDIEPSQMAIQCLQVIAEQYEQ